MATDTAIDPTVPTCGLPVELVKSARWVEVTRTYGAGAQQVTVTEKVAEINGITIHTDTPVEEYKKFLRMFPKRPVFLPLDADEMEEFARTRKRPAEILNFNGVTFTLPKGVVVEVYTPLAALVEHMNNPIRTEQAVAMAGDPNSAFHPLPSDGAVWDL